MIKKIKQLLLEDHSKLIGLLEHYGFSGFKQASSYISFGRNKDSSQKAIVIFTDDNENLFVKDYARGRNLDVFNLIIKEKNVTFKDVLDTARSLLGSFEYTSEFTQEKPFGGMFQRGRKKATKTYKILDESVLDEYEEMANERFLKDGISAKAQNFFRIGYDFTENLITIPIFSELGDLIGVKARINHEPDETENKYFYLHPCNMSQTLYGYFQNYPYLQGAKEIYVFEAEKSVMQAYTFGVRNCVALGSSSLSRYQGWLLSSLFACKIILMHDEGIEKDVIVKNCSTLKKCLPMRETKIAYWTPQEEVPSKASPTDLGKERFMRAVKETTIYD